MSPIAPAGKASTKKGSADAVCVRATYIGPAFSDTISQAAPTFCMKVPISETTLAMSKLRKVGERSGRQRLVEAELPELLTPVSIACRFHSDSITVRAQRAARGAARHRDTQLIAAARSS